MIRKGGEEIKSDSAALLRRFLNNKTCVIYGLTQKSVGQGTSLTVVFHFNAEFVGHLLVCLYVISALKKRIFGLIKFQARISAGENLRDPPFYVVLILKTNKIYANKNSLTG